MSIHWHKPVSGIGIGTRVGMGAYAYAFGYYYTRLPLNPASNKQASNSNSKQACLLSVLAITLSQRFRLYSNLAIFCIDTWLSQIQSLSPKLTSGGPERRHSSQIYAILGQKQFFSS